tara:strand:+ start:461 stop:721 length:261 start_codon:yes stop_codon:yes gene_type:complete
MNYYIVTKEIYDTLDKTKISYMHQSQDRTKRLVSTTETVSNKIEEFENLTTCSNYTFTNHSDWVGDGTGVEVWEIEKGGYIAGIDD